MVEKNEAILNWEHNLLNAIKDIADIAIQKEVWLGKNPNLVSSFDEVISVIYDDFDFEGYLKYHKSIAGEDKLYIALIDWDKLITDCHRAGDDNAIVNDPNWIFITKEAENIIPLWLSTNATH